MNDNDSLHNCLLSSFIQTPLEKWIAPPSSSRRIVSRIVSVASSVRCGALQTAQRCWVQDPPGSPVSVPQWLTFLVWDSWFQVNFSNKSDWAVYIMSPWVQEIAFLLLLFVQPSGQTPSLLVSAPDNWASASPTDPVTFQPSPLQRRPVTSAGFLWFLQIIFWLSFSVWELMFSSYLCSLKTVKMFWDVIHFPLISMCCSKPFGLWSLFLLIGMKAINWLELYILLDTYVDTEQERAWKCQSSFQFMSDQVDGFNLFKDVCVPLVLLWQIWGSWLCGTHRNLISGSPLPCWYLHNAAFSLTSTWDDLYERREAGTSSGLGLYPGVGPSTTSVLPKSLARSQTTGLRGLKPQAHFRPKCDPPGDSKSNQPSSGSSLPVVLPETLKPRGLVGRGFLVMNWGLTVSPFLLRFETPSKTSRNKPLNPSPSSSVSLYAFHWVEKVVALSAIIFCSG